MCVFTTILINASFCISFSIWISHLEGTQQITDQESTNWTQLKTGSRNLLVPIIIWMVEININRLVFSNIAFNRKSFLRIALLAPRLQLGFLLVCSCLAIFKGASVPAVVCQPSCCKVRSMSTRGTRLQIVFKAMLYLLMPINYVFHLL